VTTEKDLVKVRELVGDVPLFALRMEMTMEEGFDDFVRQRLSCG
jgi:hypothetical protein